MCTAYMFAMLVPLVTVRFFLLFVEAGWALMHVCVCVRVCLKEGNFTLRAGVPSSCLTVAALGNASVLF